MSAIGVNLGARFKANRAERILHAAIAAVTDEEVVGPVEAERQRYVACATAARLAAQS